MKIWGIAGQIGSGKTTLAEILAGMGAVNLEVDAIGYSFLGRQEVRNSLVSAFGPEILDTDGMVHRSRLGHAAFSTPEGRVALNSIMHPPMFAEVKTRMANEQRAGTSLLLINAALLYTMQLDTMCDFSIFVRASPEIRLNRIVTTRGYAEKSAKDRLWAQDSEPQAAPKVLICDNGGTLDELKKWVHVHLEPIFRS